MTENPPSEFDEQSSRAKRVRSKSESTSDHHRVSLQIVDCIF